MTHQAEIKLSGRLKRVFRFIAVGFIAISIVGIFAYNSSLQAKKKFVRLRDQVDELQALNADLKNRLYDLTDGATLGEVAIIMGLVVEKNPQYLHVGADSLVSL